MSAGTDRPRSIEREVRRRLARTQRRLGEDLERLRLDAGATKAAVATRAGVDPSFYGRIEAGAAHASLETLTALAAVLGGEVSVRLYGGSGPRLTDRHQARMEEAVIRRLAPVWRPHLEVAVWRPARGVIDLVLGRQDDPLLVVTEFESTLTRIEARIRWMAEKAQSIGSSALVGDRPTPTTSRSLVLRSTAANRDVAREFAGVLATAFPARTADAVASLVDGAPWPGPAIVWVRIDGDNVQLLDGPPRGVALGR